jgi:hypothetical protein
MLSLSKHDTIETPQPLSIPRLGVDISPFDSHQCGELFAYSTHLRSGKDGDAAYVTRETLG